MIYLAGEHDCRITDGRLRSMCLLNVIMRIQYPYLDRLCSAEYRLTGSDLMHKHKLVHADKQIE